MLQPPAGRQGSVVATVSGCPVIVLEDLRMASYLIVQIAKERAPDISIFGWPGSYAMDENACEAG
jgi:hypothetical protein